MKPENIKEAKALANRYDSITLNEIKKVWNGKGQSTAKCLTGFGNSTTCTLCVAVGYDIFDDLNNCIKCIYGYDSKDGGVACINNHNNCKSYEKIANANTPLKLRNAFKARAKNMREVLKQWD